MKYLLTVFIILLCLAIYGDAAGQQHYKKRTYNIPPPPTAPPTIDIDYETDLNCVKAYHYSLAERLKIYPFCNAAKVAIVSFKTPESILMEPDSLTQSSNYTHEYTSVPGEKGSFSKSSLSEYVVLNNPQLDSLTSLLYNYEFTRIPNVPLTRYGSGCYAPHNAILFYNKQNKLFAFIELCFTCEGIRESNNKVDSGVPCLGKFSLLKDFFSKNGITIGTSKIPAIEMPDLQLK